MLPKDDRTSNVSSQVGKQAEQRVGTHFLTMSLGCRLAN
jgi:hypothetical protein